MANRITELWRRLTLYRRLDRFERDLDEELRFHMEMKIDELVDAGMAPDAARYEALKSFGGVLHAKERARDARGVRWVEDLARDVRHGARSLLKDRRFTAVAVLTLAICLGANLTIFAVVDAVLLRPLPFSQPDRLVTTINNYPLAGAKLLRASLPNYYDYRANVSAFSSVSVVQYQSAIVGEPGSTRRVAVDRVSPEFFTTLGVPLMTGRAFTEEETDYARSNVAILTNEFWRDHFGADPNVVGKTFDVDADKMTVVGVLPPGFSYLSSEAELYIPAASAPDERSLNRRHNNEFNLIARLAPGVTLADAQAQIDALNVERAKDDPIADLAKSAGFFTEVSSLREYHTREIRPTLLLLQGAVLFLLLIGAVNLANLLLVRASARTKETAVRVSLGASRLRIVRGAVVETVLLALAGGVCGLVVAAAGIRLVAALGADKLPLGATIAFDAQLAAVALVGSVVAGLLIAVPVALLGLGRDPAIALAATSRGGTAGRASQRLRHAFVVAQIALAFVLLSGAGLLGVSLRRALEQSPGFRTEGVLTGHVALPYTGYSDEKKALAFVERLLPEVAAQPGVVSVATSTLLPFGGDSSAGIVSVEGEDPSRNRLAHYRHGIAGDYFETLDIPLVDGRYLEDADNYRSQRVCVVDESFARQYWPNESALGHRLDDGADFQSDIAATVVGVVATAKQDELTDTRPIGTVYFPFIGRADRSFAILVRTEGDPRALAPALQAAVRRVDPELPVDSVKPMRVLVDESLVARRSPAVLAGIFAAAALLLAGVGTYGVLSYAVARRRREVGIRLAIGALRSQIVGQFLSLGLRLFAAGAVIGVVGALLAGRAMRSVLFDVPTAHVATLVATAVVLGAISLLACLWPSYRASRVSPTEVLGEE